MYRLTFLYDTFKKSFMYSSCSKMHFTRCIFKCLSYKYIYRYDTCRNHFWASILSNCPVKLLFLLYSHHAEGRQSHRHPEPIMSWCLMTQRGSVTQCHGHVQFCDCEHTDTGSMKFDWQHARDNKNHSKSETSPAVWQVCLQVVREMISAT